jgi:carbon-monoxide dehydrogenase medium subunit
LKLWERYHTPTTIDEALALLNQYDGAAKIVAGGTDLLVEMRDGHHQPYPALVDVTTIRELSKIEQVDGMISLGAGVTHTQIVKSAILSARATCLVEGCGVVGGPQVRNVGTLGGNVAHALPAGDGTTSLVALDAEADIIRDGEARRVPIMEMFLGPGQSLIDSHRDLLLRFHFKLAGVGEGTAFKRIMRPQGVALPVLGCAVWVKVDEENYQDARICLAPVGPVPQRASEVEAAIIGRPTNETTVKQAIEAALEAIQPRTSKYRATADYRREMIAVLLRRSLPLAAHRARTGEAIPEGIGA